MPFLRVPVDIFFIIVGDEVERLIYSSGLNAVVRFHAYGISPGIRHPRERKTVKSSGGLDITETGSKTAAVCIPVEAESRCVCSGD